MKSLSEGIDATRQTIDRLTAGMGEKACGSPVSGKAACVSRMPCSANLMVCRTLIVMASIGAALALMLTGSDGWGWMLFAAVLVSPGRKRLGFTWRPVSQGVRGSRQAISG